MAACRALLESPKLSDDKLMELLPGPNWGCGGSVVGSDGLRDYVTAGRARSPCAGRCRWRAGTRGHHRTPTGSGQFHCAGTHPLSTSPVATCPAWPTCPISPTGATGCASWSAPKRGHDPQQLITSLLALTRWREPSPPAWWPSTPTASRGGGRCGELIASFLSLRDSVVVRRSEYRLEKVTARRHLVSGLLLVHIDIDAAVAVIRGSDTVDEARAGLCARFKIDEVQADYVLALQLRRLTKLDVIELRAEADKLDAEHAHLTELLSSPDARKKLIDAELVETAELFAGKEFDRRTTLDFDAAPVSLSPTTTAPASQTPRGVWTTWGSSPTATATFSPAGSAGRSGPMGGSSSPPVPACRPRSAMCQWHPTSPVCCVPAFCPKGRTWRW